MRKLATVRVIDEVIAHPNADKLDIVKIDGWQCVTGRGNFKAGDSCVYLEIDSFVPVDIEPFKFLADKAIKYNGGVGARIKTIRLRGEISQGLVIPVAEIANALGVDIDAVAGIEDLAVALRIVKWEPQVNEDRAFLGGNTRGSFPDFIFKTDQERLQNIWKTDRERIKNHKFEITTKLDGSSMTVYLKDGEFGVCSRNLDLVENEKNAFWQVARKRNLEEKLRRMVNLSPTSIIALQGELVGPGIQGNGGGLKELDFFVFDIQYGHGRYEEAFKRFALCAAYDINHCPVLGYDYFRFETIEEALESASGKLENGSEREGVVYKSLINPNFSFKIISNEYLLKHPNR